MAFEKMKIRLLTISLFSLFFFACENNKPQKFIYLENHSNKTEDDKGKIISIDEYVLIKNPDKNPDSLKQAMINYYYSLKLKDKDSLPYLLHRSMRFYELNSNTEPYLTSTRRYDWINRIYLEDEVEDMIGLIHYDAQYYVPKKITTICTYPSGKMKEDTLKIEQ